MTHTLLDSRRVASPASGRIRAPKPPRIARTIGDWGAILMRGCEATIDSEGVGLAAIPGLYAMMEEKDAQIAALQRDLHAAQARLDMVERHTTVIERASTSAVRGPSGFHRVGAPGQRLRSLRRRVLRSLKAHPD
jgi:hypothetical protein